MLLFVSSTRQRVGPPALGSLKAGTFKRDVYESLGALKPCWVVDVEFREGDYVVVTCADTGSVWDPSPSPSSLSSVFIITQQSLSLIIVSSPLVYMPCLFDCRWRRYQNGCFKAGPPYLFALPKNPWRRIYSRILLPLPPGSFRVRSMERLPDSKWLSTLREGCVCSRCCSVHLLTHFSTATLA
ncbi:hypothetical protein L7F22_064948 [Adiantum nelumboides]|nr:hypothetical protein [Adiantum nelumboides]